MDISLGILAGGQGSRLGGRDKGLLVLAGQPLVGRLVMAHRATVAETLITCERNAWLYGHYADRTLCDWPPRGGPVAGLIALLSACSTPLLAVLPCDQRELPNSWLNNLQSALDTLPPAAYGVFAVDAGKHTPCCLLRRSSLEPLSALFGAGCHSLGALYQQLKLQPVAIAGSGHDVDTPADLEV